MKEEAAAAGSLVRGADSAARLTREQWASYYKSDRWVSLRIEARLRLRFRCADCGRWRGVKLQLHHKHYLTFGRETINDVEWLCSCCHRRRHRRSSASRDVGRVVSSDGVRRGSAGRAGA